MNLHLFINDEQDPKVVEKLLPKINDILLAHERVSYVAVQKKPVANFLPITLIATNERLFYCEPTNLGLTTNFSHLFWTDVKSVSFKEELFGAKFICIPHQSGSIITDYIPKTQARKLAQMASSFIVAFLQTTETTAAATPVITIENKTSENPWIKVDETEKAVEENEIIEDSITIRLKKLKNLFDKQLISLEEYEQKKATILNEL